MRLNIAQPSKRAKRAAAPNDQLRLQKTRQKKPHLLVASAEGPNSQFKDPQGKVLSEGDALAEVDRLTRRSLSRLANP